MTKEEEKFLQENFPEGEFCVLTVLVRNEDVKSTIDILRESKKNMVVMPRAKATTDFLDDGTNDKKEN